MRNRRHGPGEASAGTQQGDARAMYLSIRDAMVAGDEFPSPIAGLRHLAVEAVEVRLSQEYQVYAMD